MIWKVDYSEAGKPSKEAKLKLEDKDLFWIRKIGMKRTFFSFNKQTGTVATATVRAAQLALQWDFLF